MAKFYAFVMSMLMLGMAHAADEASAEAPVVIPEPNYIGIIIFLVLMVGSAVWFILKLLKNKDSDKE